ncbi:MAG: PolC-type DNA polymerase III [Desulfomonilaceae bacterium]
MKLKWPWFRRDKHPAIIANHRRLERFDQTRPIETYQFVSLDTELTGLDLKRDAIVSIGAVRIAGLQIITGNNFFSYVRPQRSMPKVSTLIHRITPDQIESAPELRKVMPDFVDFIGNALLVGHFIGLDMAFINRAARRLMGGRLRNPCLDTMKLAQVYEERQRGGHYDRVEVAAGYNLKTLSEKYHLPRFEQHDALGDAFQAACLFVFVVRKMQGFGCRTLRDLHTASRNTPGLF